jgi:peptide/nickel transport system permease protein
VGIKYWYSDKPISTQILLNARQLILPVICLTLPSLAYVSRIMKSKFQEVGSKEFITALKAKGLSDTQILNKHIVKNGLIPFITIMTGSITKVFAGSLVLEIIFNVPGVGKLMYDSILSSDWAVISGLVIMLSLVTVIAYIIADLLYSWANPRIQLVTTDDMI